MIPYALIGAALLVATVMIHAMGTVVLVRYLTRHSAGLAEGPRWRSTFQVLMGTVLWLLFLHCIEIILWALAFLTLDLSGELQSLEEAIYFSFVTYTTLGYGDITLSGPWRIMSGIEAINGVLLAGWSTAALFALVQKILQAYQVNKEPT